MSWQGQQCYLQTAEASSPSMGVSCCHETVRWRMQRCAVQSLVTIHPANPGMAKCYPEAVWRHRAICVRVTSHTSTACHKARVPRRDRKGQQQPLVRLQPYPDARPVLCPETMWLLSAGTPGCCCNRLASSTAMWPTCGASSLRPVTLQRSSPGSPGCSQFQSWDCTESATWWLGTLMAALR